MEPGPPARSASRGGSRGWPRWLLLAAVTVFVLDRLTKFWVGHSLRLGQELFAGSPVHIHYIDNSGAAFGVLAGGGGQWFFVAVAALVVGFIGWRWRTLAGERWLPQVALGMLLGGAVANAIDRATQGYVVDFIRLPHWPIFNVADMGITVGVAIFVGASLLGGPSPRA